MLSKRLKKIADLSIGNCVADIGTDHAFIPIYLIENKLSNKCIACDIEQGPLNAAIENINSHGLNIETRLGNGIEVLKKDEADEIIIAGMGGEEICKILSSKQDISRSTRFILQPMTRQMQLRHFLVDNNYNIEAEELVFDDGKLYNIIIVSPFSEGLVYINEIDYHIPPSLKNHPLFNSLVQKKKNEFIKRITGLKKAKQTNIKELKYFEKLLGELNEATFTN